MNAIMSEYNDTLLEIDILQDLRAELVRQLEQHHRVVWTGMAPSKPMPVHVPLDKSLSKYANVVERLTDIEGEIERKREIIGGIETKLSEMTGVKNTIKFKRFVEGKSLKQIAEELGYSYSTIRKKSMGTKWEQTD